MKIRLFSSEKLGKWSLICFLLTILFLIIFFSILTIFDVKGGDTFFSNPELAIPLLLSWTMGLFALVLGIFSLIKSKSKSILVFIVMILSFCTTLFGILEVTSPH